MAIQKVIQVGHPALKKNNKFIKSFASPKTKRLIKDLIDTMYETNLIGIAAPQIAENYMIFVTHPRKTKARKLPKSDKLRIYINPQIAFLSKNKSLIYEGCGSVVGGDLFGPVARPAEIEVTAYDENGIKFSLRADGILARVIQHEMDHLLGTEFIQKVCDYNKVIVGEYYRKYIRNSPAQLSPSKITKIKYKKL